ncbi:unnamed protein product, partial [Polarella glacialis]
REVRGAYARRQEIDHMGRDAFSATTWPRTAVGSGATGAEPLGQAAMPGGGSLVAAVRPAGAKEDEWQIEVLELERGTLRTIDPARLGSGQDAMKSSRLAALCVFGTKAVVVERNGQTRVLELGLEALAEQRRQWRSMVGTEAEETLELRIEGEDFEDGEEDEGEAGENEDNGGEDDEEQETEESLEAEEVEVIGAATSELSSAWSSLSSSAASRDGKAQREFANAEVRAQVAAEALFGVRRETLGKRLGSVDSGLAPGLRQLLEASASSDAKSSLAGAADAAAAELQQARNNGLPVSQQQGAGQGSGAEGQAAAQLAVANAL